MEHQGCVVPETVLTHLFFLFMHTTQEKIAKLKAKVESLEKERDDMKDLEAQMEAKVYIYIYTDNLSIIGM